MKICIDSRDLLIIADEILHNCVMLGNVDAENAEYDIDFYCSNFSELAQDLQALVALKEEQAAKREEEHRDGEPVSSDNMGNHGD